MSLIKSVEGYVEHHLGLTLIVLAWASLLIAKLRGAKVKLPGHFFALYGAGCIVLAVGMFKKNASIGNGPALLEALIGLLAVFFYYS